MIDALIVLSIAAGAFFMLVASIGVLRLTDFYSRIHAPTKAATLGLLFLLLAVVLTIQEPVVLTKAVLALAFLGATAPVGAHILTRAAYRNDIPRSADTEIDMYASVVANRKADPAVREPSHAADLDRDPDGT